MMKTFVAALISLSLVAGCATTETGQPRTAMQRAIGQCMMSVGVGAILGAVVGNNTGQGNAGRGALTGAAAGGAVCAVLLAMAGEEDRRRVEQAQVMAASTGQPQVAEYVGADGSVRRIETRAGPEQSMTLAAAASAADGSAAADASATVPATRICRSVNTSITVENKGSTQLPQTVCRDPATNSWAPLAA